MSRQLTGLFSCLGLLLVVGCVTSTPAGPAQIDPPFPTAGPVGSAAHVYPLEEGWFEGEAVQYYNFGTNTPLDPADPTRVLVKPVYAFKVGDNPDGSPQLLEGQGGIFDVAPGDAEYTDLWQAHFVTPAPDYETDSLTSTEALLASGMTVEKQAVLVNCPFVPVGSSLADEALPIKHGWVKDTRFEYFDFGPTSATPGKVYAFVTGFDSTGQPQLVAGQHFVFDATRTSSGYSDFWQVHWVTVAEDYEADSIRAAQEIKPGTVTASQIVVNYPQK